MYTTRFERCRSRDKGIRVDWDQEPSRRRAAYVHFVMRGCALRDEGSWVSRTQRGVRLLASSGRVDGVGCGDGFSTPICFDL
jgi:hypothetical protein